jgi:hypothetical protein
MLVILFFYRIEWIPIRKKKEVSGRPVEIV